MTQLLTLTEAQQYKQLSNSINAAKFNELVLQAQFVDLLPLLGDRLYYDIQQNEGDYTDLLNGNTYEFNGITYTNVGLKCVLTHYFYARHSFYGDDIDTAFGIRQKLNSDVSTQPSTSHKKTVFEMNCNYAYNLWLSVEKYLIRTNNALYQCAGQPKQKNFKISKIG